MWQPAHHMTNIVIKNRQVLNPDVSKDLNHNVSFYSAAIEPKYLTWEFDCIGSVSILNEDKAACGDSNAWLA